MDELTSGIQYYLFNLFRDCVCKVKYVFLLSEAISTDDLKKSQITKRDEIGRKGQRKENICCKLDGSVRNIRASSE